MYDLVISDFFSLNIHSTFCIFYYSFSIFHFPFFIVILFSNFSPGFHSLLLLPAC